MADEYPEERPPDFGPCYRHPERRAVLAIGDAFGTPVPLCRDCLTAFSLWLNDQHLTAPMGPDGTPA